MSHDTIVHRAIRPAVRVLAWTPITPDHLTALRFITGLAAALAFAHGGNGWIDVGAAVFLLSALLDRGDGELARQTKRFSQHGHRYDLLADWSAGAMAFVGLGIGARGGPLGLAAPLLGVLAAAGTTMLFWGLNARAEQSPPRAGGETARVLVDPDDAMLLVPVLLWSLGSAAVLIPGGTLAPLFAIWIWLRIRSARVRRATQLRAPNSVETRTRPGEFSRS